MSDTNVHVCACGQLLDETLECPECLGSGADLVVDWFTLDSDDCDGIDLENPVDTLDYSDDSDVYHNCAESPTTYLKSADSLQVSSGSTLHESNGHSAEMTRSGTSDAFICTHCNKLRDVVCSGCAGLYCARCTPHQTCDACQIQDLVPDCICFANTCAIL